MRFTIIFYKLPDGTEPVAEFLDSLDNDMANKIQREILLLEEYGNMLREPHTKPLGDGIFELRAKFASNISRVLFFFYYKGMIILTNGFVKKTEKTPPEEIKKAKDARDDFIKRQRG